MGSNKCVKGHDDSVATRAFRLGYRPELDGLRGISILLVYFHHLYYPLVPGGFFGVDVFFVLSGFLITSLLLEEWSRQGSISLKAFYIRRALRLMPALLVVVLITGSFALFLLKGRRAVETYQGIWLTLSYASNWFYAFTLFSANNPLGITWSLAIEEQFYLTWPLLLALFLRFRLGHRWILYGLTLLIVLISLHRKILVAQGGSIFRLYYASDTRADTLLIGCLAGILISWNLLPYDTRFKVFMKSSAALAVIFLAYLVGISSWTDLMLYQHGGYTLVALSIALILTVVIIWPPKFVLLVLKFAPLVWIGRISYGLYLWHWPVRWFIYQKKAMPSSGAQLVTAIVLSLSLTALSYYFIEKPFLRWKKRFGYK
ncbi:MAG: acyltransferase family protein [Thermodesulfobacteriota bacterium]